MQDNLLKLNVADVWQPPSGVSYLKKEICVTTQAVFRLSLQLARVAA